MEPKKFLPIGYPLSYSFEGEHISAYTIERVGIENPLLTNEEFATWVYFFQNGVEIPTDAPIEALLTKKVLLAYNSLDDLLNQLLCLNALRNGTSVEQGDIVSIPSGDGHIPLTPFQHSVWLKADGHITIESIINAMSLADNENDFVNAVIFLVKANLLCLR